MLQKQLRKSDLLSEEPWEELVGPCIMYDILCRAAYAQLKANSHSDITPGHWADVLEAAVTAVSKYGGARADYRTLLDALIPASLVLKERLSAGDAPVDAFVLSSQAALDGAESTRKMQA